METTALDKKSGNDIEPKDSDSARFLKYYYPEIKDLAKHFLTLISGAIVVSVTFADKIIDFSHAGLVQKLALIFSWLLLVVSLGCCGIGLYLAFVASEQATGSVLYDYGRDFKYFGRKSYAFLDGAGVCFGAGLCAMIIAAAVRF
jgi:hypothetical protein